MNDRDSGILMADVAMHKGRGEEEVIEQAAENIRRLGHITKLVIKTDNEPALISLRDEVIKKLDVQAVPETPPQAESQSNGCKENGVKLLKGVLRVHLFAL